MAPQVVYTQTRGNGSFLVGFRDGGSITERTYPAGFWLGTTDSIPAIGTTFDAIPEIPVGVPVGASVSRLLQTIAPGGQVISQTIDLSTGESVLAEYIYGANSATIPEKVTRRIEDKRPILLNLRISPSGTQILYESQQYPITSIAGTMTGNYIGTPFSRTLTYVSPGVLSISSTAIPLIVDRVRATIILYPSGKEFYYNKIANLSTVP
jgi:hypothetical protein